MAYPASARAVRSASVLIAAALLSLPHGGNAEEARLLFHAPFEGGSTTATVGTLREPLDTALLSHEQGPGGRNAIKLPLNGQLVYEGSGNSYIPSGTISFWWRPDEDVQSPESSVLALGSFQRFYFTRWLRITTKGRKLTATLYHSDGAEAVNDTAAFPSLGVETRKRNIQYTLNAKTKLTKGEWYHVAATWDFGKGFALYVNGKLVGKQPAPWFFGGNVDHLGLGSSYGRGGGTTTSRSYADVRVYDGWLDSDDIAALAKNETITGKVDFGPMLRERALRLGLGRNLSLPEENASEPTALWLHQTGALTARDLLRNSFSALDGDLGRAWPLYQGYSRSGESLTIDFAPGSRFNTVQALGSGPMQVDAPETVLSLTSPRTELASVLLPKEVETSKVTIVRKAGLLFQTSFFNAQNRAFPEAGDEWTLYALKPVPAAESGEPLISSEFAAYDQLVLAAAKGEAGENTSVTLGAEKAVHLLGPAAESEQGLGAIAIDLALENAPAEVDLCVMVIDPVSYERRAVVATFRAKASDKGKADQLRTVIDLRDLIYEPGSRPWVVLYPSVDLKIDPAKSRIGIQTIPVAQARAEFVHDQLTLVNDAFQEMSEGRPWARDPKKVKRLGSLLRRIDAVRRVDPQNALANGYWHWTHPTEDVPKLPLPVVPEGTPAWAVYTDKAIDMFRDSAHWWIDNRQSEEGEFGAPDGINDDTDLIQDWLAIDLMRGPDPKIREAVRKVADLSWRTTTTDGVSNQVTDTLHIYEWGINAQTLAFLLEYGDPVYYERLLRFASRYQDLMTEACDGKHLHFKSWFFGANKTVTEGIYGRDIQLNALLLQPAMLLAWYNGDPTSRDIVTRWTSSMRDHLMDRAKAQGRVPGFAVEIPSGNVIPESHIRLAFADSAWASWRLTGDTSFRDYAGSLIDFEMKRKPTEGLHTTASIVGAYLTETGDSRWDALWPKKATEPDVTRRSLHNGNYKELDYFRAAWIRTGDDKWLDDGSALTLSSLLWSMPMLTEAQPTTDRVWLPQRLANQMTLGGLSILRNQIFPKHSVSWENASGRYAPLVRKQTREELVMEVCNLEDRPLNVTSRLWALEAGIYEVKYVATSRKNPNQPATEWTKELEVERFTALPLEVPADATATVTLTLKKLLPDFRERPDLALSPLDAFYNPADGKLTVTIHNIGPVVSGPFRVKAEQGGREIASQEFEPLGSPKEFRTQKARFEIPVSGTMAGKPVTVTINADTREIATVNNRLEILPKTLPAKPL